MKTFNIHFIRHGVTKGNISGAYIGATDIPLAPEGILKLKSLKQSLEQQKL